jgi:alpha-glucosidase
MRFMPYFYTLFHEASINGLPVVRPTYWADLKDPALRSEDDSFLLGNDVLIVPDMVPDRTRAVAMPKPGPNGTWKPFDFTAQSGADNPEKADPDLPKLYIRPGAIVPISPVMQYVDEKPLDTLTLLINLDASGKATGTLYEDAGDGWSYKQGDYLLTTYAAEKKGNEITVTVSKSEGKRERPSRKVVVQIAGTTTTATGTDGQPIKITTK